MKYFKGGNYKVNLLFSINHNFISMLLSCANSISINGGCDSYNAYILHSDLTEDDQNYIKTEISDKFKCEFINVPAKIFDGFPESSRYPVQIYYRLAAARLLPKSVDRVLYLDVDTIVINPLKDLYNMDFEGNWFAACTHTKEFIRKFNKIRLKIKDDVPYINTGIMLMNLEELRKNLHFSDIRNYTLENQMLLFLPDQDVLTALYGEKVKLIDSLIYNVNDRVLFFHNADPRNKRIGLDWVRENSVIIHYFGKNKPWNREYFGILDVFYHEYGLPLDGN